MNAACPKIRLVLVGALTLGFTVGPLCATSAGLICPLGQATHNDGADHFAVGSCCCGEACECLNCPAADSHDQQNKKPAPVASTGNRELVKINVIGGVHWPPAAGVVGDSPFFPAAAGDCVDPPTLISLHTCLRV